MGDEQLTLEDRVARGADWLDTNYPDWWRTINLDLLDVGDCTVCVLGQLYGDFEEGARRFAQSHGLDVFDHDTYGTQTDVAVEFAWQGGFDVIREIELPQYEYPRMNLLWDQLIRDRRAQVQA